MIIDRFQTTRNALVTTMLLVLALGGCRESLKPTMDRLLDEGSQERLAQLADDADVLVSLHGVEEADIPGAILEAGRKLNQQGDAVLLEVAMASLPGLAETPGLTKA